MNNQNQFQTLRALRGAPLSCLIALAIRHTPTGVMQLCADTGYKKDVIREGLLVLQSLAFATKVARFDAWQLTDIGYQLPLLPQEGAKIEGDKIALDPLTTITTIYGVLSPAREIVAVVETEGDKIALDSPQGFQQVIHRETAQPVDSSPEYNQTLEALHQAGIRGKKADELAKLEWVTPEYIQAHVKKALDDGQRLGLAIYRMECGDETPEEPLETRNKYIGGKYAEYIEH